MTNVLMKISKQISTRREKSIKEKIEQDLEISHDLLCTNPRLGHITDVLGVAKLVGEERRYLETQANAQKQIESVMEQTAKMFGFDSAAQWLEAGKPDNSDNPKRN
jgi:hypothetical protein